MGAGVGVLVVAVGYGGGGGVVDVVEIRVCCWKLGMSSLFPNRVIARYRRIRSQILAITAYLLLPHISYPVYRFATFTCM